MCELTILQSARSSEISGFRQQRSVYAVSSMAICDSYRLLSNATVSMSIEGFCQRRQRKNMRYSHTTDRLASCIVPLTPACEGSQRLILDTPQCVCMRCWCATPKSTPSAKAARLALPLYTTRGWPRPCVRKSGLTECVAHRVKRSRELLHRRLSCSMMFPPPASLIVRPSSPGEPTLCLCSSAISFHD